MAVAGALYAPWLMPVSAQVFLEPTDSPWNALDVFEPTPFARQWERASGRGPSTAPEDNPVKTRQHPGYEPVGGRLGSWMFHPSLTVGSRYDNNVFSSSTIKSGDVALRAQPALRADTLWGRHSVSLQGDLRAHRYRRFSGLDRTDANLRARTRIDLSHAAVLLGNFRAASLNESVGSLSSPAGAVEPTPYSLMSGEAAYRHRFSRMTASVGGRFESYDFGTTRAQDGTIIDQSSRDGQIYAAHSRLDYAVSPKLGLFTALEINRREIRGTPTVPLGSDGYRMLAGVNLELSRLITGEFGIGHARQRFDSATIGPIAGPSYRATLTWSPTRLVDLYMKAERIVTQASETDAAGIRADVVQLGVDYEFRRNIVLSLSGTYEKDRFFGRDRTDTVHASLAEARYRLNRTYSLSLSHRYIRRTSTIPLFSYDKHEVGVDVTARF